MKRAAGLAFVTAFVTLFVQILIHRMVSAKLHNNYAFLVISLTMLGFAISGVVLSRWLPRFLENLNDAVVLCAASFAVSTIVASALFYHAAGPYHARSQFEFLRDVLHSIPFALLYAVPFVFCGLILGALLSSRDFSARRIYFFDLLGSATGALLVLPAINHLGVERSALAACALMLIAALFLAPPRRRAAWRVAGGAALLIALSAAMSHWLFEMRYPEGSMLSTARNPASGWVIEHLAWDPLSRIEVSRVPPPDPRTFAYPALIGENRQFLSRFKRVLTQNNFAFTFAVDYDGTKASLTGIEETIYSAAYYGTSVARPRVLVIGVGAGFDILTALYFDASEIIGVEVNGATLRILTRVYRDYFRHWIENPRVHLVHAEGRHFLETTSKKFDVIQLSGVDSYSGTPAVAHVFSENYLYTEEAFDLYLARLNDNGILSMMRLAHAPPREMLRALTTAVGALRRAGSRRPADHIVMLTSTSGNFTAMLVKKTPFTESEVQRIETWVSGSRWFAVSAAPRLNPQHSSMYQFFLSLGTSELETAFMRAYRFDIWPISDDRPFFFRYSFWWHIFPGSPAARTSIPVMESNILMLFVMISLAALLCVYVPLRHLTVRESLTPSRWRHGLFFAGIGLGYLAMEMALLQKFGLFLGHPNYALSVVLAALLFSTGLGSLYSERIVRAFRQLRFVSYALAGILFFEYLLILPLLPALQTLAFWSRSAIVFALVMPLGVCLGTFMPSGLERLKLEAPAFIPWAWGINGIFSVLAPVLSIAFSMSWGISVLLLAAIPVYLLVGLIFPESPETRPACSGHWTASRHTAERRRP